MNFHLKINYYMLLINYFLTNFVLKVIKKYDLFDAQATIDEMRLKYSNSFLNDIQVIMNRNIVQVKFKRI